MCWLAGSEKSERVGYEGGLPSFWLHAWGMFFTSQHTEPRRRLLGGKISSGWDMLPWRCPWDTHMKKCGCLQVPLAPAHPAFSASQPPPSPIFHNHPRATGQWKVPMLTLDSQGPRFPGPSIQQWFASYGWAITDPPDFQPALTEGWGFFTLVSPAKCGMLSPSI